MGVSVGLGEDLLLDLLLRIVLVLQMLIHCLQRFERFLNPDRVSLPDIDIDFDDEGRAKIIEILPLKNGKSVKNYYLWDYGSCRPSRCCSCIELPLHEADRIAKLVPDISLHKLFNLSKKN